MAKVIKFSPKAVALETHEGFAHEWVETAEGIYDFVREAIKDECDCGCGECGGFPLSQLANEEILLAPGAIYRARNTKEPTELKKPSPSAEDKVKGEAVMQFVNSIIGAYEAGFIDSHELTLADLYLCAKMHVTDNYHIATPKLNDAWGDGAEEWCKNG
ncbi:hypothetical protein [Vibrio sp. STUT-A11]|uniref:hypothetical protein n=1 Tax=Vibrio sp. STUT-A11 TaxID=2976236 RepID=UPI0022315006|nr:hypothetical protein [Vibrio sp. STUT-A11]BDR12902.1 hypothetical protein VspSTUT11_08780 [Vibrio sp. STUT-A11]